MHFIPNFTLERLEKISPSGWAILTLGPLILTVILIYFIWTGTFNRIHQEEQAEIRDIQSSSFNVAQIIAADLDEVLGKGDLYADMSIAIVKGKRDGLANFNPVFFGDHAFLRLAVFDTDSRLLFSTARNAREPLLSALVGESTKKTLQSNTLIVGHPDNHNGNDWRVPVLFPLGEQGKLGFLGAHLDLGYFLKLYQDLNLGRSGKIEIIGDDGYQLIESSGTIISAGRDISTSDYFAFFQKRVQGSGIARRPGEKSDSIVAFDRVDHFPFTVAVSRNVVEALAEQSVRRANYIWEAIFQTMALLIAVASLTVLAQRQKGIYATSLKSEQEKQLLIEQLEVEKNSAYKLASHDHLTGIPNRLLFAELATNKLLAARRSQKFNAAFFIDLDHFKQINDTLGHRVGDLLLCEVASRLQNCVRDSDLVARFGGDEFVMLISDASSVNDVGQLAAKIVESVGQPCKLDGHDIEVRPSLGIALYGRDGQNVETLLKHADAAMYEAKAAGRGTFRFYDEALNRIAVLHSELALQLRHAIADGELRLHFQAQAALEDFRVTGLEALVRWQHPEHGLIFPGDFLPLAEEDSLIILPLGHWVIDAACHQLATWKAQDVPLVPVYINVSPRQFREKNLVNRIFAALDKYSLSGELLGIEITENCVTDDPEQAIAQLKALRARGVLVTMDDFKSGFSNISLLNDLRLSTLMIDRSLIGDIHNHHNDAIIVDSIITLAHKLGFRILAEGVETREQVLHLKLAGCNEVQGYFFQRPAPANETESILRQGKFEKL